MPMGWVVTVFRGEFPDDRHQPEGWGGLMLGSELETEAAESVTPADFQPAGGGV